ncbi:MAG: phage terminase large subunit [Myxococcaceae bacterium]
MSERLPTSDLIEAAMARRSLGAWARRVLPRGYETPSHVLRIISLLERMERGELHRAIVCLPPRHGKSLLCSIAFPSWYFGRHPDREVFVTSYSQPIAGGFSRRAREAIIQHGEVVFGLKLSQESHSVESWALEGQSGAFHSAGAGGSMTGKGASLLVIDDPYAGPEQADSEIEREKIREWFSSVAMTRLSLKPRGACLLVQTRWRPDDLAGFLIEQEKVGGEHWELLSLPMVEDRAPYTIHDGPILWPEMVSREDVERIRIGKTAREWEALYQQRPTPPGGSIFHRKDFKTYRTAPKCARMVAVVDSSFKSGAGADPVCLHLWGRFGNDAYLLDRVSERMDFPETVKAVQDFHRKWPTAKILVELKANGQAILDTLKKQGVPIVAMPVPRVQTGKEGRAHSVAFYVEAGRVYFPDPMVAPWVRDVFDELARFPHAPHDDDVDCMCYGLLEILPGAVSYWDGIPSPRQLREFSAQQGRGDGWTYPDHSGDRDAFNSGRRC